MHLKLKKGEQFNILKEAIKKAGSQRKLAKILDIPYQSIGGYALGEVIPELRFDKISNFLNIKNKEDLIEKRLPDNWKQIKGGKKCVLSKKKKGTFNRDMKVLQDIQSIKLKKWHKFMKNNKPREYYNIQYSRFKKVGHYNCKTKKGEKVRNIFEKNVADILFENNINYKYEPLVHIGKRFFFPDFLLNNNIIIECTMWKGIEKAYKLKEKINILEKRYKVFVVIPQNLYSYYKIIDDNLIQGLDKFALVAQTFLKK